MLNIKLDPELSEAVARQARREKKTRTAVVRSAVAAYLEESADAADVAKRSREDSISLKQLGKRLGLES
ncbi:MAG: ribbon-helix-helix protein, CopG family [Thiobacillaceae bacterium]